MEAACGLASLCGEDSDTGQDTLENADAPNRSDLENQVAIAKAGVVPQLLALLNPGNCPRELAMATRVLRYITSEPCLEQLSEEAVLPKSFEGDGDLALIAAMLRSGNVEADPVNVFGLRREAAKLISNLCTNPVHKDAERDRVIHKFADLDVAESGRRPSGAAS